MKIDPNAPAFPNHSERTEIVRNSDGVVIDKSHWGEPIGGMSIRVWLAGQALPCIVPAVLAACRITEAKNGEDIEVAMNGARLAKMACGVADALIAELNK